MLKGDGFAAAEPAPDVPEPAWAAARRAALGGPARAHLVGRGTNATAEWAAKLGDEPAKLDAQDRRERQAVPRAAGGAIRVFREAWKAAGHTREPRVSVSRSIFALVDDRRVYSGRDSEGARTRSASSATTRSGTSLAAATPPSRTRRLSSSESTSHR